MHLLFDIKVENKNRGVELNLSDFGKDNIKRYKDLFL